MDVADGDATHILVDERIYIYMEDGDSAKDIVFSSSVYLFRIN